MKCIKSLADRRPHASMLFVFCVFDRVVEAKFSAAVSDIQRIAHFCVEFKISTTFIVTSKVALVFETLSC